MTQDEAQTELSTMLADTLQQVSEDRLSAAISTAWRDSYVTNQVIDESLTFSAGTYIYAVPTTVTTIESIGIKLNATSGVSPLSNDLWEIIGSEIRFNSNVDRYLDSGTVLSIRGRRKVLDAETIDTDSALHDYVINLAAWNILKYMGISKIMSFLNNDTSMADVINFRRELERDIKYYRLQLTPAYVDN